MAMATVRRIAAGILGVGECKVKFRTDSLSKIGEALTREDIRSLVKDGSIYAIARRGVSRVRGRDNQDQKRKGRRSSHGSRRGTSASRKSGKESWMERVRAQRSLLSSLIEGKKMDMASSRRIYVMIKGNAFKGVKVLEAYLKENKLLK